MIGPERSLGCGRPLYDYGMLTLTERQLRQILDTLRPEIDAGTPGLRRPLLTSCPSLESRRSRDDREGSRDDVPRVDWIIRRG